MQRNTVYTWIESYATAQQALQNARESALDNAESILYKKILDGDTTALIFFLKTQGKNRGYSERHEQHVTGTIDVHNLSDEELRSIVAGESGG